MSLSPERTQLFAEAEAALHYQAQIYPLGNRFEGLSSSLASIYVLDVTQVPGCHYGLKNVFVPIIKHLEETRPTGRMRVSPENAILVEPSTGNGWVAFSDAAEKLGYEHFVVMPDGLPDARYKHPLGRNVKIVMTPKENYAAGIPVKLQELMEENRQRLRNGEKFYISPNHAVSSSLITIKTMAELAHQLVNKLATREEHLRVFISMGNGSSLCSVGEYLKENRPGSAVVATESFAYGGGYDRFARTKEIEGYQDLYGIEPGHRALMDKFSTFGTNAPIGIELPLQTRAFSGDLLDDYILCMDRSVLAAYIKLNPEHRYLKHALQLPNYSYLPDSLYEAFGNSTLANIAAASTFSIPNEIRIAVAYDSRSNY